MSSAGRLCACREILCLSSLYSPLLKNQRFFLAVTFSTCGLGFWASAACIWGLQRRAGQVTAVLALTLRHGVSRILILLLWGIYSSEQRFCWHTHSLLSFLFTGGSSSFSTNKSNTQTSSDAVSSDHSILDECCPSAPQYTQGPQKSSQTAAQAQGRTNPTWAEREPKGSPRARNLCEWMRGLEVCKHQDIGINKGIASLPMCPSWFDSHCTVSTQLVFSLFSAFIKIQTMPLANI